jgi:hypothetical protein
MIEIKCNEHKRHSQWEKLLVEEHALNRGYAIHFDQTQKLHRTTTYTNQMVKEANEIQLHPHNPHNFNKEHVIPLSICSNQPNRLGSMNSQPHPPPVMAHIPSRAQTRGR